MQLTPIFKTGDRKPVYLNKYSNAILEKYDWEVPSRTNQEVNRVIKEVGKIAGLNSEQLVIKKYGDRNVKSSMKKWEMLTTHVGRHTYIILSLEGGIRPEVLMKQTGHKSIRIMMNYVEITETVVKEEFDKVWNKK